VTNFFSRSTILIARHSQEGAWGVIVNRVFTSMESGLSRIMLSQGIELDDNLDQPLYVGGPVETNRLHVIHSLDWHSNSTIQVTEGLGITNDLSILAAIAGREGPENFRVCVGMCGWAPGQLEGEMSGKPPWLPEHRWLHAAADPNSVFDFQENFQWQQAIHMAARATTQAWL